MDSQKIFDSVKERILIMKDVSRDEVSLDSLFSSLNFDSLDYVELQVFILDCYGVRVNDELFVQQEIASIGQLVKYVISNMKE